MARTDCLESQEPRGLLEMLGESAHWHRQLPIGGDHNDVISVGATISGGEHITLKSTTNSDWRAVASHQCPRLARLRTARAPVASGGRPAECARHQLVVAPAASSAPLRDAALRGRRLSYRRRGVGVASAVDSSRSVMPAPHKVAAAASSWFCRPFCPRVERCRTGLWKQSLEMEIASLAALCVLKGLR